MERLNFLKNMLFFFFFCAFLKGSDITVIEIVGVHNFLFLENDNFYFKRTPSPSMAYRLYLYIGKKKKNIKLNNRD